MGYVSMKTSFKKTARPAVAWIGGNSYRYIFRERMKDALTVFIFHDVTSHPSEFSRTFDLYVTSETFRVQLQFIKKNFQVVGVDDLLSNTRKFERPALITFDDGFRSYFTEAAGILEEMGIPSVIFLNMEPIKGEIFFAGLATFLCLKDEKFIEYLKHRVPKSQWRPPFFLLCQRPLAEEYLKEFHLDVRDSVARFVGEFASLEDLRLVEGNPLVSFGNHLFGHEVARLLTDDELKKTYKANEEILKRYSNYRPVFSFPFGQPGSCFNFEQIDLIRQWGARLIFSSSEHINKSVEQSLLDRISLTEFHSTPARIWYQTLRNFTPRMPWDEGLNYRTVNQ